MEKVVLKSALALVIIILLCVYCSNIFSLEAPSGYDYDVKAGKTYTVKMNTNVSKNPSHVTDEVYFSLSKSDEVIVMERNYNFAKISKEIDDEVVFGYIDAWYLSDEARDIRYLDEQKLNIIEDKEMYYTPSSTYNDKYPNKFSGLCKVIATCNDYSLVKIADYDLVANDNMWIKTEDLSNYNSLKINVGFVNEEAKMFTNEKIEERASETLRDKILNSSLLKIEQDLDEYVKVKNKEGDSVVVKKSDFNVISYPSQIK